jgi:hypothetical protein
MVAKRLTPKKETMRELFLKSGNLCAFPGCGHLMMNAAGAFIGETCHIEAAEKGGPRFNANSTNEDRRRFENLMLMCHAHHVTTDDISKYTVARLKRMKSDHEKRFSDPSHVMIESFVDQTSLTSASHVKSLKFLDSTLAFGFDDETRLASIKELNAYIDSFQRVPAEVRQFVGAVAQRAYRMRRTNAASCRSHVEILVSDIQSALGLSFAKLKGLITQIDSYGLGGLGEMDSDTGLLESIRLSNLRSGWCIWGDLAKFCDTTKESMESFTLRLKFSLLDKEK